MNILKIIVITLFILISFLVVFLKPKMHKKIRIENAGFDVTQFSEEKVEKKPKPFYAPKQKPKVPESQPEKKEQTAEPTPPVNEAPRGKTPQLPPITLPQVIKPPVVKQAPIPTLAPSKQQLTAEQEEIIAWNKWRSDLQNETMKDSKVMAPVGTKFSFSLTVDKFGNISNLRIWAEPSGYTQMGIRAIRPVIMGYQGNPILNFPPKSKRVVVNIEGHFFTARSSQYSTPSDYSDFERVK